MDDTAPTDPWPVAIADNWQAFTNWNLSVIGGDLRRQVFMFRGHAVGGWRLESGLERLVREWELDWTQVADLEQDAIQDFAKLARLHLPPNLSPPDERDFVGWWALMQHYGSPTRLLDWTLSPYIAAYFACAHHPKRDGVVWCLNVHQMSQYQVERFGDKEGESAGHFFTNAVPNIVRLARPSTATDRMLAQQGLFTLASHPGGSQAESMEETWKWAADRKGDDVPYTLRRLIIPASQKGYFLHHLLRMNVAAHSLFPGLDGVGRAVGDRMRLNTAYDGRISEILRRGEEAYLRQMERTALDETES